MPGATFPQPGPDAFDRCSPEFDPRALVDNVVDYAIFSLDPRGRIVSWNAGAERITGHPADEIIGRHFSVLYSPEARAAGVPARLLATAARDGRVEDEGWRLREDGSRFWANVVITALYDERGELRGFGEVTRDVTDRRTAEQALRESEERFRLLVQSVVDYAIFMLDPDGRIVSWNAGAERIKGYPADEIIGRHFSVFYSPDAVAAGHPAEQLRVAARDGRVEDEGWRLRKDGSRFWANVVITPLYDERGELRGFGKVTRDLTERRHAEQTLTERRRLLARLVEAQESERRRIAWDVHDDSIQSMVAVGMRLQLLARSLPPEQAETVRKLDESVRGTISRLRNLVYRLRPPAIERDGGLFEALSAYLNQVVEASGVKHTLRHDLEQEPPRESAVTIFRITQEALTNVRKHAQATSVEVSLSSVQNGVLVQISDDGVGIDERDEPAEHEHFGLVEMRERAEIAGGWWTISGVPGRGTTVRFWVPASPARADTPPTPGGAT